VSSERKTIEEIRSEIQKKENTTMTVSVKTARKENVKIRGVMYAAYPNVFVICVEKNQTIRQHSFNYCDIISGKVKIQENEEPAARPAYLS